MNRSTDEIYRRTPGSVVILRYLAIGALIVLAVVLVWRFMPVDLLTAPLATEPELKVAFIGDAGFDEDMRDVLALIRDEGADMVVHLGDFDYDDDPKGYFAVVDEILGSDFPYFGIPGNHDEDVWPTGCGNANGCYAQYLSDRMSRLGIEIDDPDLNDQMYSTTFEGLRLAFVGLDNSATETVYPTFLQNALEEDPAIWKICAWHETQRAMQVGDKDDTMGWAVFETCRSEGAIVATAHEHSYQRTHTLLNFEHRVRDPLWMDPGSVRVAPGATFAFVSGLGGHSIRDQERCLPDVYPYGCHGEWARIYTSNQDADYGALFITFNVDGDKHKARGYFKNVDGDVVDNFTMTASEDPLSISAIVRPITADATVSSETPDDNLGEEPVIEVDGDPEKISYLQFGVDGINLENVTSAVLRLYVENASADESFLAMAQNEGWDESEITYNTRLLTGQQQVVIPRSEKDLWVEVDITQFVRQAAGDDVTVAISAVEADGIDFASSEAEAEFAPEVVIIVSEQE